MEKRCEVDALLLEGRKNQEVAEATGVSAGYVRARRHLLNDQRNRSKARILDTLSRLAKAAPGIPLGEALKAAANEEVGDE